MEQNCLRAGVFWVITEDSALTDWKLLAFEMPCDSNGNLTGDPGVLLNSKSGTNYNHKKLWESGIKGNPAHRPYGKRNYNYYPRGRVEIASNRATIYLSPHICKAAVVEEIQLKFGLTPDNISEVRVYPDYSPHYCCFIDL